ncbi:MAG: hypothetical protein JNK46_04510 [Methylobacteriaceae bacterium]|nr:hypothetical protein [Methylobacteriaceae bacterium]
MAILVFRQLQLLEDWNFAPVATLVDPADGRAVDALTVPDFRFVGKATEVFETVDPPPRPAVAAPGAPLVERVTTEAGNLARSALARRGRFFRLDPANTFLFLTLGACQKRAGLTVAGALLAHEQAHWDIFLLGARRVASRLAALRAVSEAGLTRQANQIAAELGVAAASNVNLAQSLYDLQTDHGANAVWQATWQGFVTRAMAEADPLVVGLAPL